LSQTLGFKYYQNARIKGGQIMASPSIAMIIDCSGSMGPGQWPGEPQAYLKFAQTDASSFVNSMSDGDFLAVVAFNESSKTVFPPSGTKAVALVDQKARTQATTAIDALTASGATNINAAIGSAISLLAGAKEGSRKGMVLLSDGDANVGVTNPHLMTVPDYPMYTIALGIHGQLTTLEVLAERTKEKGTEGKHFYISPTPFDLQRIYNDIIGEASIAAVLANNRQELKSSYKFTSATFASGAPSGTFTVVWGNTAVTYTANKTPVGNQIQVTIQDPKGTIVAAEAAAVGPGYVAFRIPSPLPGTYQVAAWYSGNVLLSVTTGIFNPDLSLVLTSAFASPSVAAGEPLRFTAAVLDGGQVVPDVRLSAVLSHPLISPEATLLAHRSRLERVGAELAAEGGGEVSDNTKAWVLQSRLGLEERLQPYGDRPVATRSDQGTHHGEIPTSIPGGHLLHLSASGTSPHSGRTFTLERCLSARVI
jgi:hypothetical protein